MYLLFLVVLVLGFWLGFAAEFCLWLLYLVPVVGFHFRNLIGCCYWYFFCFGSSIGLLSPVCDNRICLCYSFLQVDLSVDCRKYITRFIQTYC